MRVLVTGGAGFVGSHVAEHHARRNEEVIVLDNLSRGELLHCDPAYTIYNWDYLGTLGNIRLVKGDIRDFALLKSVASNVDVIIHTAGQTALTTSLQDPRTDFEINALGTFNVLEAARALKPRPAVIFCSTNKVYGSNVNGIPLREGKTRYAFADKRYRKGIPEDFPIDLCEHSPYGASKLAADIYVQDYAQRSEVDAAIFRMSSIYGPRQFGTFDQGWVAWLTIATLAGKPIIIDGDGKQVRDILHISDLNRAFDLFIEKRQQIHCGVYNMGGGVSNSLSLRELLDLLEKLEGRRSPVNYREWRPADQKVYISDTSKAQKELGWRVTIGIQKGVEEVVNWVKEHPEMFSQ